MDTVLTGTPAPADRRRPRNGFDRFFEISTRGYTMGREIRGGLATFFTMAYIVVLNPLILCNAVDGDGKRFAIPALAVATALVAGLMTILMGVVGRFPLARRQARAGQGTGGTPLLYGVGLLFVVYFLHSPIEAMVH